MKRAKLILLITLLISNLSVEAQFEANYDEAKVPDYQLPDPLVFANGKPIRTKAEWITLRRQEILGMFAEQMFGITPTAKLDVWFKQRSIDDNALNGLAIRKEVDAYFSNKNDTLLMTILLYIPKKAKVQVPVFLGYNFDGNQTINADPGISITQNWVENDKQYGITDNKANEATRGIAASRWQVEMILKRGYALATAYYGDIDPDFDDGFKNGLQPLFYSAGQTQPAANEWGSIGAWSWGLSRMLDYLETDPQINATRAIVIGHSRLGKAALWAGAQDERFAVVISNNSGCGGAALSRRAFGETVARINSHFPHWFCDNFNQYNNNENALPIDQHELIALIAPRPVYIASAKEDLWADPKGEFLAAVHASPVYHLLGKQGLVATEMPAVDVPIKTSIIGYHIRSGKHDITPYDWEQYLDFADLHLKRKK